VAAGETDGTARVPEDPDAGAAPKRGGLARAAEHAIAVGTPDAAKPGKSPGEKPRSPQPLAATNRESGRISPTR